MLWAANTTHIYIYIYRSHMDETLIKNINVKYIWSGTILKSNWTDIYFRDKITVNLLSNRNCLLVQSLHSMIVPTSACSMSQSVEVSAILSPININYTYSQLCVNLATHQPNPLKFNLLCILFFNDTFFISVHLAFYVDWQHSICRLMTIFTKPRYSHPQCNVTIIQLTIV